LRLALDALESGEAHRSPLVAELLQKFPAAAPAELARQIYKSEAPRSTVASLAPIVTQLADVNDSEALGIIYGAASDLARLVARTAQLLEFELKPFPLAMSGGVLANCESLREALAKELTAAKLPTSAHVVADPLEGCLRLADVNVAGDLIQWHGATE
jgi:N-acetylglucosamine kinase-like BadF-type ATPase